MQKKKIFGGIFIILMVLTSIPLLSQDAPNNKIEDTIKIIVQGEIQDIRKQMESSENRIKDLEKRLEALEDENKILKKDQETLKEENEILKKSLSDLAKQINKGIVHPHNKTLKWAVTNGSQMTFSDIDLDLDNTNAKYLLAVVFLSHDKDQQDHVNYLFGHSFPNETWTFPNNQIYYNSNETDSSTYVVCVHRGDSAGSADIYGTHEFVIIPLKENKRMDVRLAHGYNGVGTHFVKLRAIGYIE